MINLFKMSKVKSQLTQVDKTKAQLLLKKNANNRPLSPTHVDFLAQQMKSGQWLFDGQAIRLRGDGHLLDGQHRLQAVIESDTVQQFLIVSGIDGEAFKVMDTGKKRNAGDIFSINHIDYPNESAGATRLAMEFRKNGWKKDGRGNRISTTDLIEFYEAHPRLGKLVPKACKWSKEFSRVLPASQIAGLWFVMSQKNVTDAETFWRKVCTGLDLEENSPMLYIRNMLIEDKIANKRMKKDVRYAQIVLAWNKFRKGEQVKKKLPYKAGKDNFPKII